MCNWLSLSSYCRFDSLIFMNSRATEASVVSCESGNDSDLCFFWILFCLLPKFLGSPFAYVNFLLIKAVDRSPSAFEEINPQQGLTLLSSLIFIPSSICSCQNGVLSAFWFDKKSLVQAKSDTVSVRQKPHRFPSFRSRRTRFLGRIWSCISSGTFRSHS